MCVCVVRSGSVKYHWHEIYSLVEHLAHKFIRSVMGSLCVCVCVCVCVRERISVFSDPSSVYFVWVCIMVVF